MRITDISEKFHPWNFSLPQSKTRFCFAPEFNGLRQRIRRHIHVPLVGLVT